MRQLSYSMPKLLILAAAGVVLSLAALAIPFDANIATGHVAGVYLIFLYEIGPSGRWAFAIASTTFFLFGSFRLVITAMGDGIALHSNENGILVRTITKHKQMVWNDVISIDTSSSNYRKRIRRSIRVRINGNGGPESLFVPISFLAADEFETSDWITEACRMHAGDHNPQRIRSGQVSSSGFGRKRSNIIK